MATIRRKSIPTSRNDIYKMSQSNLSKGDPNSNSVNTLSRAVRGITRKSSPRKTTIDPPASSHVHNSKSLISPRAQTLDPDEQPQRPMNVQAQINRIRSLQRQHDRETYRHKFPMKEEAFQVANKQRSDSPALIDNKKQFDRAVYDTLMKEFTITHSEAFDSKFVRKTRMGGHMSTVLGQAGLSKLGIASTSPQRQDTGVKPMLAKQLTQTSNFSVR